MWVFIGSPVPAVRGCCGCWVTPPAPLCREQLKGCPLRSWGRTALRTGRSGPGPGAPGTTRMRSPAILWRRSPCPTPCGCWTARRFTTAARLRRVTLGPGVEGFGSDLFTNCRQLQTFRLRAAADAPTGLKKLLGAVSADITVELDGAQLFYPEYSEFLDENTPAHIFNHSIEGEGYRMRQCFTPAARWITPRLMRRLRRPASARTRINSAG